MTRRSHWFARLSRTAGPVRTGGMPGSSRSGRERVPGHDGWCAAALSAISGEHAHDVALLHDQELFAVELDLGARPLAEQHAIADLEVDRDQLAAFITAAGSDGGDFTLRGFFLGAV